MYVVTKETRGNRTQKSVKRKSFFPSKGFLISCNMTANFSSNNNVSHSYFITEFISEIHKIEHKVKQHEYYRCAIIVK